MFAAVCDLGLEGIVSKKLDAPYRSGPSKAWIKVKPEGSGDTGARRNILIAGGSLLLILELERLGPARVLESAAGSRPPIPPGWRHFEAWGCYTPSPA